MPDSLEDQLRDLEQRISSIPDAIDAAMTKAFGAYPSAAAPGSVAPVTPSASRSMPAPAAEPTPQNIVEVIRQKATAYDPTTGQLPDPLLYQMMTTAEQDAAQGVIEAVRNGASLDEQMRAKMTWDRLWAQGHEARAEKLLAYREAVQAQQAAAAAEAEQAKAQMAEMHHRDVARLAPQLQNQTLGERFAAATELGVLSMSDHDLARHGYGPRELAYLAAVKERIVEVNPDLIRGQGFQTAELDGGRVAALVPGHFDVHSFAGKFGPDAKPEQGERPIHSDNVWTHDAD